MLIKGVCVIIPNGNISTCDVEVHGSKGNETYVIRYYNRRVTPYEQKKRGWKFTLNGLHKLTYSGVLSDLIPPNGILEIK